MGPHLLAVLLLFGSIHVNDGYKFLVFGSTSSRSHMIVAGRIADTLAEGGHNVTVLVFQHALSATDFKFTNQRIIPAGSITETSVEMVTRSKKMLTENVFKGSSLFDTWHMGASCSESFVKSCENILIENQREIQMLKEENFDAMFVGQLFPCGSALSHVLGIKVHFLINSCPIMDHIATVMGLPTPLGYVPTTANFETLDTMTFTERMGNEFESWMTVSYWKVFEGTTKLFRKYYGKDFPEVTKIIKESPLVFTMVDEILDFPRPTFNKNINMGGIGVSISSKALPDPFTAEIKKGRNGTVFFSLGSNMETSFLPFIVKKNILDAFAAFPDYHFIVKLDKNDLEGLEYARKIKNIYSTHWAPQSELLKQPELKLFITHGGYNSILEVAHAGKPCLLIPMMFDQHRNAKVTERNGWGRMLDRKSLLHTKEVLVKDLKDMLHDQSYAKAALRVQKLLKSKPFSPKELFLKNIRYVMENDGVLPELQPAAVYLSYVEQFNLDVYFVVFFGLLAFLFFLTYGFRYVFNVFLNPFLTNLNIEKKLQ